VAKHSHKRETALRKPPAVLLAASLATLATAGAITVGVAGTDVPDDLTAVDDTSQAAGAVSDVPSVEREPLVSRSGGDRQKGTTIQRAPTAAEKAMRAQAVQAAIRGADTELWTTEVLNLWTRPDKQATKVGELDEGKKVLVTGRNVAGREEVVVGGKSRWVTEGYLDDEKPVSTQNGVGGECTNGSSIDAGVSAGIVKIHQAVCARWPTITTYGTLRGGGGDHGAGRAVDIMVAGATGWEVAEYVRANYQAFGVSYVIYSQKIWSVERSSEGWRGMSDRGSTTANHYDHVHVSVY
jgi:hypothetical protein